MDHRAQFAIATFWLLSWESSKWKYHTWCYFPLFTYALWNWFFALMLMLQKKIVLSLVATISLTFNFLSNELCTYYVKTLATWHEVVAIQLFYFLPFHGWLMLRQLMPVAQFRFKRIYRLAARIGYSMDKLDRAKKSTFALNKTITFDSVSSF